MLFPNIALGNSKYTRVLGYRVLVSVVFVLLEYAVILQTARS